MPYWKNMVMMVVATILWGVVCGVHSYAESENPLHLEQYLGKNLIALSPEELLPLTTFLQQRVPKPHPWYSPYSVWQRDTEHDSQEFIMLEVETLPTIPSADMLYVHVYNPDTDTMRTWFCSAGWRQVIVGAGYTYNTPLQQSIIMIATQNVLYANKKPADRHYYGIHDDELYLIRIEKGTGELVPNTYAAPNRMIGIQDVMWKAEGVLEMLTSDRPVALLAALVFLGGSHLYPVQPSTMLHEPLEQAQIAQDLFHDPVVKERIQHLQASELTWIREAASLALQNFGQ